MLWLILAFSAFTRLFNLSFPPNFYFDEVYNAFTTLEFVKGKRAAYEWWHPSPGGGTAYGWTHPPLAKLISALGVLAFGPNSFGWRVTNVLVGVGVIYLTYLISLDLLNAKRYALVAAALAATDGLLLVQSRINMNDIVATFFVLLSFWAFIRYRLRATRPALVRLGLMLGLLVSTKWTGLYAVALFGTWLVFSHRKIILLGVSLLVIPAAVYLLSYSQYFILGGTWKNFLELQKQMWWYNTNLEASHAYQSPWWSWPLMLRPVWYFVDYGKDTVANIYAQGNPILWWLGLPAILFTIYYSLKTKSWRTWLIVVGYLSFWLPWAAAPRVMFIYHYLPAVPFLCIALAYSASQISISHRKFVVIGICGLVIGIFVYFYPHWTGLPVSLAWAQQYFWLTSWR